MSKRLLLFPLLHQYYMEMGFQKGNPTQESDTSMAKVHFAREAARKILFDIKYNGS
ncbi:MAG: hypothetical protein HC817_05040 [Saprospiraceae bacterium]|nr:hypothetical protein [Saprospiraceae bacterium]